MFDTVLGLPLHPLVVHAVVVLGPLAALLLVAYAAVPRWRAGLRWPTVACALVAGCAAVVATEAGEALAARVGEPGFEHEERGELARTALLILAAVTLVVVFLVARVEAATARVGVALILSIAAAVFATGAVALAGHSGAKAVWTSVIDSTSGS
ncbi:DUF2231 domain-containing protein [Nostocoides jenkinsii]|uniref:DUF2231 domain-containing protein n=1 Tax=Nostocoides jenkinsii Ben 74 TaxID=1193518 RepID=A0A077M895_9MICO|nr:DUF2231 domain-containing protein [Tetrasphaera jenkinsii]CCI53521.1 conserved membrane hypothetical protein [Tetrasphaera jenkinsii Ben 74]